MNFIKKILILNYNLILKINNELAGIFTNI